MAQSQVLTAYGAKTKRAFYEGQWAALKAERSSYDSLWRELGEYILPGRTRFVASDKRAQRRYSKIINSTGRGGARTLQSGMHAGLTSPARPWFRLTTPDPDLAKFASVKTWLHTVTERMETVFSTTNLYNALPTIYGDMSTFGTAAMSLLSDVPEFMRAYTYPLGSYTLGIDRRGLVTVFMFEAERTVLQLVEEFGGMAGLPLEKGDQIDWSRFSKQVRTMWDKGQYHAPMPTLWVIAPNREYDGKIGPGYWRWTSCHFERQGDGADAEKILRESGFNTFPIFAPRWETTEGDAYGTDCPGMMALGDVKQLHMQEKKKGVAIEKMVDPSLVGPTALRTQKTSLLPGAVTYADTREGMAGLRAIHEINLNLQHLAFDMDRVERRVDRAYYSDLFLMMSAPDATRGGQPITAEEVRERHEEKLLVLGPVLQRTNDELLNGIIDRAYALMEEEGLIPDPPQELDGVQLKVEYISILAEAQKLVNVSAQDRFLSTVGQLAEAFPEVRRKVNVFQAVDNYADMLGVDPRLVLSDEDAQAAIDADNRQQQALATAQVAKDAATAGKAASETKLDNDNALTRLTSAIRG